MQAETARQSGQPEVARRRWRLPRIPLRRPPLFVAVLTGAIIGMYFQPLPLRLFFQWTGLEPGGGSSAPFAVPAARASASAGQVDW